MEQTGQNQPFGCATLSAGRNAAVVTDNGTGAWTAVSIAVLPQTVDRTIVAISTSHRKGTMVYTMLLDSTSWLAKLTGETTVTVYANRNLHEIEKAVLAMSDAARFNGFLFKVNGSLVMFADVEADRPGHPIGPN
jgi:hypothetical protein